MSSDSDLAQMGRFLRERKKERHAHNKEANTIAVMQAGLVFSIANDGEVFLFREPFMPKVDFFPSTGAWYVHASTKGEKVQKFNGGANGFIGWYRKRLKKVEADRTISELIAKGID